MSTVRNPPLAPLVKRLGKLGLVLPASFLFNFSIGLVNFAALFFLKRQFNASTATIGLFAGVWNSAYLLGCIVLRPVFGRFRPRLAIATAPVAVALLLGGLVASRSLVFDFLVYALSGFSVALFWPPLMGWLTAGIEGEKLARTTAWYNLSWSIGNIVSPLTAGLLVETTHNLSFVVAVAMLLSVAAMTVGSLLVVPDRRRRELAVPLSAPVQIPEDSRSRAPARGAEHHGTPYRIPAWLGLLSAYLFLGVLLSVFPLYAHYRLGIPESLVGLILVARALSMTLAFVAIARTRFWHFRTLPMAAAQIVLAAVSLLMPFGRGPLFFILVLPFAGAALSLVYSSSLFHSVSGASDRSGRAAMNEAILTLGMVAGSSLGGWIYERFSMRVLFTLYAALLVCVAAYQLWAGIRLRSPGSRFPGGSIVRNRTQKKAA